VTMWAEINLNSVYHQILKLERHGFLVSRGHSYRDFRSRISLTKLTSGGLHGEYCGLTSSLYVVVGTATPQRIAVAPREPGRPAKLSIYWPESERYSVRDACRKADIEVVPKLW